MSPICRVSLLLFVALLSFHCCLAATVYMITTGTEGLTCSPRHGGETPKDCTNIQTMANICMANANVCHIPRTYDPRLNDDVILTPKKRPFCNAFTGCGRKRSQNIPGMPVQELFRQRQFDDDAVMPILDSESSSIDDLSRQIINAARLVEAIQDASAEIARRKQNEIFNQ